MAGKLIYGGSFNPVHSGHLRIAIETFEMLGNFVSSLDFVPAAHHPWKKNTCMLPLETRCRLIRAAISAFPHMRCNELESRRPGPSYTVDTMRAYGEKFSPRDLYFLLGSMDYALLPKWREGLRLPIFCNLVIVPRGDYGINDFTDMTTSFWKLAEQDGETTARIKYASGAVAMMLPNGARVFYLPAPFLEISASHVRDLWLCCRNIQYLVPDVVKEILDNEKQDVLASWQEKETQC